MYILYIYIYIYRCSIFLFNNCRQYSVLIHGVSYMYVTSFCHHSLCSVKITNVIAHRITDIFVNTCKKEVKH